ncbi:MAG: HD domain-containing protein [Isosphaeraceae bacterium]
MATGAEPTVVRLGELEDGREAVVFATLVKKTRGTTKKGEPFIKCIFRDRATTVEAPLWANHRLLRQAESWPEGIAYRLTARASYDARFGLQIDLLDIRPASDELDGPDGYNFFDLVETSDQPPEQLFAKVVQFVERGIDDPYLRRLVLDILNAHAGLLMKMPAAQNFHHSYTGGLIEHVWSMTRIAQFLANHYAAYYHQLDPPLNKGVILAATVLHDIGKLRELEYHPVEAKYTTPGCLIGHVLMGRDMVREAARAIEGFPEETLLCLEHAILAHHGKKEYGAPIVPQTIEALLVSYIDDLDAKMNIAARNRLTCNTDGDFTDKVFALDNRRFYKGARLNPLLDDDDPCDDGPL